MVHFDHEYVSENISIDECTFVDGKNIEVRQSIGRRLLIDASVFDEIRIVNSRVKKLSLRYNSIEEFTREFNNYGSNGVNNEKAEKFIRDTKEIISSADPTKWRYKQQ